MGEKIFMRPLPGHTVRGLDEAGEPKDFGPGEVFGMDDQKEAARLARRGVAESVEADAVDAPAPSPVPGVTKLAGKPAAGPAPAKAKPARKGKGGGSDNQAGGGKADGPPAG